MLPRQLGDGRYKGRWCDPHNARPAYHYIMLRGLTSLYSVLPENDPLQDRLAESIRNGLSTRNREFPAKGVMNSDSSLEALLAVKALQALRRRGDRPGRRREILRVRVEPIGAVSPRLYRLHGTIVESVPTGRPAPPFPFSHRSRRRGGKDSRLRDVLDS